MLKKGSMIIHICPLVLCLLPNAMVRKTTMFYLPKILAYRNMKNKACFEKAGTLHQRQYASCCVQYGSTFQINIQSKQHKMSH